MTRIQFHDWIIFLKKERMPMHCLFMSNICTYAFSKIFKNILTLECLLLHICLSLPKSPALQRTLIHSSFKPLKPILLNRYMSVPWKVWISESRWKYRHMLLKNILILLNFSEYVLLHFRPPFLLFLYVRSIAFHSYSL